MMPMADPRVFIGINFFLKKTKLYDMKTLVWDDNILLEDSYLNCTMVLLSSNIYNRLSNMKLLKIIDHQYYKIWFSII